MGAKRQFEKDAEELALEAELFFEDRKGTQVTAQVPKVTSDFVTEQVVDTSRPALWVDSDDENLAVDISSVARTRKLRKTDKETIVAGADYSSRLRQQFASIHGDQKWASSSAVVEKNLEDSDDEDLAILQSSTRSKLRAVDKKPITIRKLVDVNAREGSKTGPIVSLSWQVGETVSLPSAGSTALVSDAPLLASVAISDKGLVRVWKVVGSKEHELIASIKPDRRFRVSSAVFITSSLLAMVGPQRGLLVFDVINGKEHIFLPSIAGRVDKKLIQIFPGNSTHFAILAEDNEVLLMRKEGFMFVASLKVSADIVGVDFNDKDVFVADKLCSVYRFDLKGKCLQRLVDDQTVGVASMVVNEKFVLLGSNTGTIDCISLEDGKLPKSVGEENTKTFQRLTTQVESLAFLDSGVFVAASKARANAIRACFTESGHTLAGWPRNTDKFGAVTRVAVKGNLLVMGTQQGKLKLFQYKRA